MTLREKINKFRVDSVCGVGWCSVYRSVSDTSWLSIWNSIEVSAMISVHASNERKLKSYVFKRKN